MRKGSRSLYRSRTALKVYRPPYPGLCIDTLALNGLALPPFFAVADCPHGHKADLPAEQSAPQTHPRVPCAHGHQERPQGARAPARQGPAQADTLTPAACAPVSLRVAPAASEKSSLGSMPGRLT